jgi:NAD dependent epimerase/dehydratase family enzyme
MSIDFYFCPFTNFFLGFMVLYMINYPAIQQKLHDELVNVCGDSLPSLTHRARFKKEIVKSKQTYAHSLI